MDVLCLTKHAKDPVYGPALPTFLTKPDPDSKPYEWWHRLPTLEEGSDLQEALTRACRRLNPNWLHRYSREPFRLGVIGQGCFREVSEVLTHGGYRTGLVIKRPISGVVSGRSLNLRDNGNGQETAIYLFLAGSRPDLLQHFPILFETSEDGAWAIHERVIIGSQGVVPVRALAHEISQAGILPGDTKADNVGRHPKRHTTVFADYGHFYNRRDDVNRTYNGSYSSPDPAPF